MKTINKRQPKLDNNVQVFIDEKTGKSYGFAGEVEVYNSKIYIDTRDGTGYGEAIKKLEPLICRLASQFIFNGNTFDDTRHDVIVHILEGIPKYNPNKNTKLSSFIEMRVNRRLINDLRDKNRKSRNATLLNYTLYNVRCQCGFNSMEELEDLSEYRCPKCERYVEDARKIPVGQQEILTGSESYDEDMYSTDEVMDDNLIFIHDMENWLHGQDKRVVKIIELIYFNDYSIKAAAEEVGLSGAGGNMKLKDLAKNKTMREIFNR